MSSVIADRYSLRVSALEILRKNLKRLRERQRLTQQDLAERAGIDYKYAQRIEAGHWPGLRLKTIEKLAEALGVPAWQLLKPARKASATASRAKDQQGAA